MQALTLCTRVWKETRMRTDGITLVFLTQGKVAIIDSVDAEHILAHKWCFSGGYAVRNRESPRTGLMVHMHREILSTPNDMETDHINGNGIDNRRVNLRPATPSQNQRNKGLQRNSTSGYKGVCLDKSRGLWLAHIKSGGRFSNLGRFQTAEEAARAYDTAARERFGEFARPNFPEH